MNGNTICNVVIFEAVTLESALPLKTWSRIQYQGIRGFTSLEMAQILAKEEPKVMTQ